MGLNLSIRRIIFFSGLRKFDGVEDRPLTMAEIKQVAGRAGRFGSRYPAGVVTATTEADLARVREALAQPSEEVAAAYLAPSLAQLEMLGAAHPQVCRAHQQLPVAWLELVELRWPLCVRSRLGHPLTLCWPVQRTYS
jgi:replicative superfamily II helicase